MSLLALSAFGASLLATGAEVAPILEAAPATYATVAFEAEPPQSALVRARQRAQRRARRQAQEEADREWEMEQQEAEQAEVEAQTESQPTPAQQPPVQTITPPASDTPAQPVQNGSPQ